MKGSMIPTIPVKLRARARDGKAKAHANGGMQQARRQRYLVRLDSSPACHRRWKIHAIALLARKTAFRGNTERQSRAGKREIAKAIG